MEQLNVIEKEGANYKQYTLQGALNAYTLGEFSEKLYNDAVKVNVVLDMSDLIELDMSGIGCLMAAFNDAEDAGKKIYFLNMQKRLEKMLVRILVLRLVRLWLQLIIKYILVVILRMLVYKVFVLRDVLLLKL